MMRFIVFQTVVGLLLVGLWGTPSRAQTSAVILPTPKTGDTYIIEYRDPDNPKLTYSTERTVIAIGEGTITVAAKNLNSKTGKARTLQFTSEWNLISSRNPDGTGFDYAPPLKYFAFPLSSGKTWQQMSQETNLKTGAVREYTLAATVGEWEEVTVPAGTFRAIKVTLQTDVVDRSTGEKSTGTDISWYAPQMRRSVKSDTTSHNVQGQQKSELIQLLRYDLKEAQSPVPDGVAQSSGRGANPAAAQTTQRETAGASSKTLGEPVVIPGTKVGNFSLGMRKEDMLKIAPTPHDNSSGRLVYKNPKTGNILIAHFQDNKIVQIDFSNKDFQTEEGINTGNFRDQKYEGLFDRGLLLGTFPNRQFMLKTGGLTFYDLQGVSSNPAYPVGVLGVVHAGYTPLYEVDGIPGKEHGGWTPGRQEETHTNRSEVAGRFQNPQEQERPTEKPATQVRVAVAKLPVLQPPIPVVQPPSEQFQEFKDLLPPPPSGVLHSLWEFTTSNLGILLLVIVAILVILARIGARWAMMTYKFTSRRSP